MGGRTTVGVVRVGNTVRRPVKATGAFTQELLRHLDNQAFSGAPKLLGIDSMGREILTYIPGSVPAELGYFSDDQLVSAARLLRRFHDATLNSPLRGKFEVVCHGDASPCNCVFESGIPKAFIDFDDAHPGSRLEDLGYAAWLWTDIGNDELAVDVQARRLARFFAHYGERVDEAIAAIITAQVSLAKRTNTAGTREWANNCRAWVEVNRTELSAEIAARAGIAIGN